MPRFIDLTGHRVGRLTVLSRGINANNGKPRWICRCDCGNETLAHAYSLRAAHTQSCGCLQRERTGAAAKISSRTHGKSKTPSWRSWSAMRSRCYNPNATGYERYGGRGVTVCERWHIFENFLADMGERPSPNHSIDRIDVNGNYEPSNCRWATRIEQQNNKRNNLVVVIRGTKTTFANALRNAHSPVGPSSVARRIARGWSAEDAIAKPHTPSRLGRPKRLTASGS